MCPQYPQIPQSHERERIQCVGGSVGRRHLPFVHDMNEEQSLQLSPKKSVDLTTRQILQSAEMEALLQFLILCPDISVVWCPRFELFLHSGHCRPELPSHQQFRGTIPNFKGSCPIRHQS